MKLTVIGTGYVGLVSGACLADVGNMVLCLDLDAGKIGMLQSGGIPIYEPGLKEIVASNVAAGRLRFTTNVDETAEAGPEHPIRVEIDPVTQEPAPYVHVRTNLEALIHRNVFYQLVELAVSRKIDGQNWLGVWSGGEFFRIGLEP